MTGAGSRRLCQRCLSLTNCKWWLSYFSPFAFSEKAADIWLMELLCMLADRQVEAAVRKDGTLADGERVKRNTRSA